MTETPEHADIREAVRKLCAGFPGEYWRRLDRERAYPAEFVKALTEAGFLAALAAAPAAVGLLAPATVAVMAGREAGSRQRRSVSTSK